jgi:hypothetical protein
MPSELTDTAIVPLPAAAARAAAIAARRKAPDLVFVPESSPAKAAEITRPQIQFSDCLEPAFCGVVVIGALLFAAAMLRFCWAAHLISRACLDAAAASLYAFGGIVGCVVVVSFGHGVFSILKQRG